MYRDAFRPRTQLTGEEREKQPPVVPRAVPKAMSPTREDSHEKSPDTDAASSITISDREISSKGDDDVEDMKTEIADELETVADTHVAKDGQTSNDNQDKRTVSDTDKVNIDTSNVKQSDKSPTTHITTTSHVVEKLPFVLAEVKKIEKRKNHGVDKTDGSNGVESSIKFDRGDPVVDEKEHAYPTKVDTIGPDSLHKVESAQTVDGLEPDSQDKKGKHTEHKNGSNELETSTEDTKLKQDTDDPKRSQPEKSVSDMHTTSVPHSQNNEISDVKKDTKTEQMTESSISETELNPDRKVTFEPTDTQLNDNASINHATDTQHIKNGVSVIQNDTTKSHIVESPVYEAKLEDKTTQNVSSGTKQSIDTVSASEDIAIETTQKDTKTDQIPESPIQLNGNKHGDTKDVSSTEKILVNHETDVQNKTSDAHDHEHEQTSKWHVSEKQTESLTEPTITSHNNTSKSKATEPTRIVPENKIREIDNQNINKTENASEKYETENKHTNDIHVVNNGKGQSDLTMVSENSKSSSQKVDTSNKNDEKSNADVLDNSAQKGNGISSDEKATHSGSGAGQKGKSPDVEMYTIESVETHAIPVAIEQSSKVIHAEVHASDVHDKTDIGIKPSQDIKEPTVENKFELTTQPKDTYNKKDTQSYLCGTEIRTADHQQGGNDKQDVHTDSNSKSPIESSTVEDKSEFTHKQDGINDNDSSKIEHTAVSPVVTQTPAILSEESVSSEIHPTVVESKSNEPCRTITATADRVEIKTVDNVTSDKERILNEMEANMKNNGMENVVEKTEDKVLETKVKSEIIEQTMNEEDTAVVEESPTKERPDDIQGILIPDVDEELYPKPNESSTKTVPAADNTESQSTHNSVTPDDNKCQSSTADKRHNAERNIITEVPAAKDENSSENVLCASPPIGDNERNTPTTIAKAEANLHLTNDQVESLKNKDKSPVVELEEKVESKAVGGAQHVPQTDETSKIDESTTVKSNEPDMVKASDTVLSKPDVTKSSSNQTADTQNGYIASDTDDIKIKDDIISTESNKIINGHSENASMDVAAATDAITNDKKDGKLPTDKPKVAFEPTHNGIPESTDNTAEGEKTDKTGEVEENGLPDKGGDEPTDSQVSMKMMRGEVSAKTTYQRTSTGPIAISEVSPEGKYIMLENTSSGPNRRDVNLDGWRMRRTVDGKRDYVYNFRNFTLKSGKKVKILARGSAAEAGLNDLVFRDEDNWGVGAQVSTGLINDKEEEKASHVQKTLYN